MMKKNFLLAIAFLATSALSSCSRPNGDPKHDAEAFQDLLKKKYELELKDREITTQYMEYYIANEDLDAWNDYEQEVTKLEEEYNEQKQDIKDKIKDLEKDMSNDE